MCCCAVPCCRGCSHELGPDLRAKPASELDKQAARFSLVIRRSPIQPLGETPHDAPVEVSGRADKPVARKVDHVEAAREGHQFSALKLGQAEGDAVERKASSLLEIGRAHV